MTGWRKRQVIEMAREAGFEQAGHDSFQELTARMEAFAELVRADEREMLAQPAPYMAVSTDRMSVDPHTGYVSIGTVAQPAPVQEPVAWQFMNGSIFRKRRPDDFSDLAPDGLPYWRPLYTAPPQRTWVGLTDKELEEFSEAKLGSYDLCLEVEARLRSKNA